eukprot:203956_1
MNPKLSLQRPVAVHQNDGKPTLTPSSASYKQELMDASLLLDNINEAVSMWDTQQSNTHSLQPQYNMLFSPSLSTIIINNNTKSKRKGQKKRDSKSSNSSPQRDRNREREKQKNIDLNSYETFYMKDDSSINHKHHKSSKKHSKSHRNRHAHNISRTVLNIRNMDDIPSFLQINEDRLRLLAEMIELKRNELERISVRHDHTLQCIIDLYISATDNVLLLRKQHGDLSSFAFELSREGQLRNTRSDLILSTLHNIDEQRKNLLNKIESPSWEIKHHFHILSFEHFRGNQQPHLLEIAQVLPSRLQIAAISHHSTLKNDQLLQQFNVARKESELLSKKLGQIDKKRNLTQCHLKDYKKMMTIIKKNIGEKRLNKLKKEREKERNSSNNDTTSNANSMYNSKPSNVNAHDRFRRQYLKRIGIDKSEKKAFNLTQFVTQINRFLGQPEKETIEEMKELKNNTDLVNPITGCIANNANNKESEKETQTEKNGDKDKEEHRQNEEKQSDTEGNTKQLLRNDNGNQKFVFKEKKQMQNILNIIDKSQFVVNTQQRTEKENIIKTIYYVDVRRDEEETKEDVRMRMDCNENKENRQMDKDNERIEEMDGMQVVVEPLKKGEARKEDVIDAPHRDWSVLAKHLKDSSKEQARRKQILKQLERILQVREGLQLGFNQLKEIYESQTKQITNSTK